MSKSGWACVVGAVMIVGGLAMFFVFRDVDTPVVGVRQAGLVIAVLGALEVGLTGWSMIGSRRTQRR
jgi:hypothetical protein